MPTICSVEANAPFVEAHLGRPNGGKLGVKSDLEFYAYAREHGLGV